MVVGTDAGAALARFDEAAHVEMELLTGAGWTPLEAMEAGTLGAAIAIGRESCGSIEPGKLADLLVVRGDPTRTSATSARSSGSSWAARPVADGAGSLDGRRPHAVAGRRDRRAAVALGGSRVKAASGPGRRRTSGDSTAPARR